MCGIFLAITDKPQEKIRIEFKKGESRGPDHTYFNKFNIDSRILYLGFHRLSINGLNEKSNQPFIRDSVMIICNGEIYNYKYLYKMIDECSETDSDCEIIMNLYLKFGIRETVKLLDGVFAIIVIDMNENTIYFARDPLGVRPMFLCYNGDEIFLSSELKQINNFKRNHTEVQQVKNGHYYIYHDFKLNEYKYFTLSNVRLISTDNNLLVKNGLINAVKKRLLSDRPIACLLSGGLDSSLITSIVSYLCKQQNNNFKLNTFSIGLQGSTDLIYAKKVSEYLNTNHTEIILTENEFFNSIPEVIKIIESYDTTTVRASVGNYLVCKYIKEKTDFKVIFNGDGADELAGGYLYFKNAPTLIDFNIECNRLLENICFYDVLRSDKSISSNGLEPRTPFLDKNFVNMYLSIPVEYRKQDQEKKLIRDSFCDNFLPDDVLYRKKEAFSDGVSSENRSWYKIIHEKLMTKKEFDGLLGIDAEKEYYLRLFKSYYPKCENIIPGYWMPKWSNTIDPSARTL